MFDKLVTKVNAIDIEAPSTSGLVSKKQYDLDKQKLGKGLMTLIKKDT